MGGIYNRDYARIWIEHHESGDDEFRTRHLHPFLEDRLSDLRGGSVLDAGCGWGKALDYLDHTVYYHGVDVEADFFEYVRKKHPGHARMRLDRGGLPDDMPAEDGAYDVVVCSMVLHTVPDLGASVRTLCRKARDGGRIIVATFSDSSRDYLRSCFERIDRSADDCLAGSFVLPSKRTVNCEIYFHGEDNYQRQLSAYGACSKSMLGPIFAAYECTKAA